MVKSICAKQNKCRLARHVPFWSMTFVDVPVVDIKENTNLLHNANHFSRQFDEAVTKVFTASSIVKEEKSQKIKVFTASSTVKERRPSQHTHF